MSDAPGLASRVFVAGHRGLAGSAIVRQLREAGYSNLLLKPRSELDLADARQVSALFEAERPEVVVLAAAKVGGILANSRHPADFIRENLAIQTNVIEQSRLAGVSRLLFLGSSCIYPRDCPQPIREEYLLTGPLEETNRAYAIAKIAGIEMCGAYNEQYGTRFACAMPTNLYGPGDNYDLQSSHLLPALLRKAHEAKAAGARQMVAWGTGKPRRELLLSDDLARACVVMLQADWSRLQAAFPSARVPLVNVGTGVDCSIAEIAQTVRDVVGFEGTISWDTTKPDGTPQKKLDVSRIHSLGWRARTPLREGIALAYRSFQDSLAAA